jgi:hypothetical protein
MWERVGEHSGSHSLYTIEPEKPGAPGLDSETWESTNPIELPDSHEHFSLFFCRSITSFSAACIAGCEKTLVGRENVSGHDFSRAAKA